MADTRRAVDEWIGKNPDTPIPPRVKERILTAQGHRCAHCGNTFHANLRPEIDHVTALINGGQNREGNLQALCDLCHVPKTAEDVALKSTVARKRSKHLGIAPKSARPLPGGRNSKFKIKVGGDTVLRCHVTGRIE